MTSDAPFVWDNIWSYLSDPEDLINTTVYSGPLQHHSLKDGVDVNDVVANLSRMEGVDWYARADIPQHLHFR